MKQPSDLTLAQATCFRLKQQHLLKPAPRSHLTSVVADVCGVQAQVLSAAELALSARVRGLTHSALQTELWQKRTLVKTYGPRGTLHVLPASELPLWAAAMQGQTLLSKEPLYADLSHKKTEALLDAIGVALDGHNLTREELTERVVSRVGSWARPGLASTWGLLLRPAADRGLLCFGPSRGSKVTFVRADQWIGGWQQHDPYEALQEICKSYFAAYGPATPEDFGGWFGLWNKTAAKQLVDSVKRELVEVRLDGRPAFVHADNKPSPRTIELDQLHLLPQYDCYVIANVRRAGLIEPSGRQRILSYGRGRYESATGLPVLLINGIVSGIWERKETTRGLALRVESFVKLSAFQKKKVAAEAARIAAFFETDHTLTFGKLT